MKLFFKERNIAAILFVLVLITFSMAQKDTPKIEQFYNGIIHSSLQISFKPVPGPKPDIETTTQLPAAEKTVVN